MRADVFTQFQKWLDERNAGEEHLLVLQVVDVIDRDDIDALIESVARMRYVKSVWFHDAMLPENFGDSRTLSVLLHIGDNSDDYIRAQILDQLEVLLPLSAHVSGLFPMDGSLMEIILDEASPLANAPAVTMSKQ